MPQKRPKYFKRSKHSVSEESIVVKKEVVQSTKHSEPEKSPQKPEKKIRPHFPKIPRSIPDVSVKVTTNPSEIQSKFVLLNAFQHLKITLPSGKQGFRIKSKMTMSIMVILILGEILWNYFVAIALYKTLTSWSSLLLKREQLTEKMLLWENITKEYPNYRDAYVEGALFAYQLGDREEEAYFLTNLKLLDPNFPVTKSLEKLIELQQIN